MEGVRAVAIFLGLFLVGGAFLNAEENRCSDRMRSISEICQSASTGLEASQKEIQAIDVQIQKLEKKKQKHVALAKKYQAEGDRWQYNTGRIDDAHEAWGKADDERAQVIDLQRQIDLLYERKNRIYQFYPELQRNS